VDLGQSAEDRGAAGQAAAAPGGSDHGLRGRDHGARIVFRDEVIGRGVDRVHGIRGEASELRLSLQQIRYDREPSPTGNAEASWLVPAVSTTSGTVPSERT
jgi:hypothetical protein